VALGENDLAGVSLQDLDHCLKHDDIPPIFTGQLPKILHPNYTTPFIPAQPLF
jgi:hypothetical protein